MRGRNLLLGGAVILAIFTGLLWYTQYYAYYAAYPEPSGGFLGGSYPVETWQGIDGTSSPLKLRVCATVSDATAQRLAQDLETSDPGEPLVAPSWFDCFDAKTISRDLQGGRAGFYLIGPSSFQGIDEAMALYPDGRIFIWRQLAPEFQG